MSAGEEPRGRVPAGPGEVTLVAFVLAAIGAYSIAQGAGRDHEALVVVGVFAWSLLVIGLVWPVVALRGLRVRARVPVDARVGDPVDVHLHLEGRTARLAVRLLDPPGPWQRCSAPGEGHVAHVPRRRGVFRYLRVEARTAGPLGVFARRRVLTVELPRAVLVAPRPTPTRADPAGVPADAGEPAGGATSLPGGDEVRAVRPYVPGDPARLVHWPSTARAGEVVVRELEPPRVTGIVVVVDCTGAPAEVEPEVASAAGLADAALAAGGHVVLATVEAGGPVLAAVATPREVGRRLARAVPGAPPEPPPGWPVRRFAAGAPS